MPYALNDSLFNQLIDEVKAGKVGSDVNLRLMVLTTHEPDPFRISNQIILTKPQLEQLAKDEELEALSAGNPRRSYRSWLQGLGLVDALGEASLVTKTVEKYDEQKLIESESESLLLPTPAEFKDSLMSLEISLKDLLVGKDGIAVKFGHIHDAFEAMGVPMHQRFAILSVGDDESMLQGETQMFYGIGVSGKTAEDKETPVIKMIRREDPISFGGMVVMSPEFKPEADAALRTYLSDYQFAGLSKDSAIAYAATGIISEATNREEFLVAPYNPDLTQPIYAPSLGRPAVTHKISEPTSLFTLGLYNPTGAVDMKNIVGSVGLDAMHHAHGADPAIPALCKELADRTAGSGIDPHASADLRDFFDASIAKLLAERMAAGARLWLGHLVLTAASRFHVTEVHALQAFHQALVLTTNRPPFRIHEAKAVEWEIPRAASVMRTSGGGSATVDSTLEVKPV